MAYMHKMLKIHNSDMSVSWIKNMLYNYVFIQPPSYLMEFKCNFHFYASLFFETYGILSVMTSESARLVISVHMLFL